jgi:hypothetical protein
MLVEVAVRGAIKGRPNTSLETTRVNVAKIRVSSYQSRVVKFVHTSERASQLRPFDGLVPHSFAAVYLTDILLLLYAHPFDILRRV